ncbi:MAG: hypothetical protein ACHQD8_03670 [Chitinophagales bacterium]
MKQLFLSVFFAAITLCCNAQSYICFAPSITNSPGTLAEKANLSIEVGRQWDVFSLGLDMGMTTLGKVDGRDTAFYFEARPNLNIFQVGKFTNTFTPGIGVIFNAEENLMTELTYGIEYTWTPLIHINMVFGQYYYSGRKTASSVTFFGISIMKYFAPYKSKALINKHD